MLIHHKGYYFSGSYLAIRWITIGTICSPAFGMKDTEHTETMLLHRYYSYYRCK